MLNARELQSRYEIMVETYNKTVNVEGQLMVLMAKRYILPAAIEYQKNVAQSVAALKGAGVTSPETKKVLATVIKLTSEFSRGIDKLQRRSTTVAETPASTPGTSATRSSRR